MAEKYGPFNSGTGAAFDETQWREIFGNLLTPGVIKGAKVAGSAGGDLAVSVVGGNMNVNIATGCGLVYGFAYENDATATKTITTQGGGLNRIDTVILKLDFVARTVLLAVKSGTAASSPVAPSLTQSATTWEAPLCDIFVTNGASVLVSGNLTDRRAFCAAIVPPSMGSGSLLDADKLDGNDSTAFLIKTSGGTVSGATDFTNTLTKSGNTVWHAGNDGAGSGLDADLLDGQSSTAFPLVGSGSGFASRTIGVGDIAHRPSAGNKGSIYIETPFS